MECPICWHGLCRRRNEISIHAAAVLTVEINEDTPVADAAGGVLEERHAVGELLVPGRAVAGHVDEVAGVDDGVAEAEDALVAAAQTWGEVEQEDAGDEQAGGQALEDPHLDLNSERQHLPC